MRLIRNRRARIWVEGDSLRVTLPCEGIEEIREWVRKLEARGDECTADLENVGLEELLEKLSKSGFRAVVGVSSIDVRKSTGLLVCPVCLSAEVKRVDLVGLMPPIYVCEKCGYRGSLLLEVERTPAE